MDTMHYITVVPSQNQVIVDGITKIIPNLEKDPRLSNIRAIQWTGEDSGHIEFEMPEDSIFYYEIDSKDFTSKVAPFLAMWEKQVTADEKALADIENSKEYKVENILRIRKEELAATDYIVLPDYEASETLKEKAIAYRKWLRDITKLPGFPWDGGKEETPWHEAYPWAGK